MTPIKGTGISTGSLDGWFHSPLIAYDKKLADEMANRSFAQLWEVWERDYWRALCSKDAPERLEDSVFWDNYSFADARLIAARIWPTPYIITRNGRRTQVMPLLD